MAHVRAALAIATVLAVGVTPAVLGGTATAAVPPAAGTATTSTTGTVVQEGGPLVVTSGEEGAVTTRITVTLPTGHTGPVKARLLLPKPTWQWPDGAEGYDPVTPTCAVNGGAFSSCPWNIPGNEVVFPATEASTTVTYDIRVDADSRAAVMGTLTATFEVTDETGAVIGSGPVVFRFVSGTVEASRRTTVLARDKAGVLWQYPSSGRDDKPLKARQRIGGGWDIYTSITALGWRTAAGQGDLVARDKAGVLWHYEGSGNPAAPFKPRVRVGGGWNTYTAITANAGGLVARDQEGVLWKYTRPFAEPDGGEVSTDLFWPRQRMGHGWNAYNVIEGQGYDDDAVARDASGVLWSYRMARDSSTGGAYSPRGRVGGGWNVYKSLTWAQNLNGRGQDDLLAVDKNGRLWLYESSSWNYGQLPSSIRKEIGWGWDIYDEIL
ncbi:hypothetical protein AB0A76_02180 [Streptomyces exfoliatus]|uniref:Uncharacterized protein n=1 Tax=Streptomyces exfoliatus TaxID=1905 RepID=A0ABV3CP72_STREX